MPDLRRAFRAARPVVARQALTFRKRRAVELRAGHQVVHVRRVAAAVHDFALLGDRVFLAQLVVVAVADRRRLSATFTPFALNHGPEPMRSLALTPGLPLAAAC